MEVLASKCSPWLVLAGDSNVRKIHEELMRQLEEAGIQPVVSACMTGQEEWCRTTWFDNDAIFLTKHSRRPFRISMRFQTCAEERLPSINRNWTTVGQCCHRPDSTHFECETKCRQPANLSSAQWHRPHALFYGHGLWSLPPVESDVSCAAIASECGSSPPNRHMLLAKQLKALSKEVQVFRWVTNFPLEWHPKTRLWHLEADFRCQKQAAAAEGLPLLDLWRHIGMDDIPHYVKDWHLQQFVQQDVLTEILNLL